MLCCQTKMRIFRQKRKMSKQIIASVSILLTTANLDILYLLINLFSVLIVSSVISFVCVFYVIVNIKFSCVVNLTHMKSVILPKLSR